VPKRATNSEILRLVRSEKLRVPNGMRSPLVGDASVLVKLDEVYYYDMLFSLCWRCCGVAMKSSDLVQETMQMLKNRGMYSVLNEVRRATPPAHCAHQATNRVFAPVSCFL
jgi:hypothetical protein